MNYLELVKDLADELQTMEPDDIPSVSDPPKPLEPKARRLATWIRESWRQIQLLSDELRFRRRDATIDVAAGQDTYDLPFLFDDFQLLWPYTWNEMTRYLRLDERDRVEFLHWPRYRGWKVRKPQEGKPRLYTVNTEDQLILYPKPMEDHTLTFEYVALPQVFCDDCDTPRNMPERYHRLIVYWAIVHYAGSDEAGDQFQRGQYQYRYLSRLMMNDQIATTNVVGTR